MSSRLMAGSPGARVSVPKGDLPRLRAMAGTEPGRPGSGPSPPLRAQAPSSSLAAGVLAIAHGILPGRAPPMPPAAADAVKGLDLVLLFGAGLPILVAILVVADSRGRFAVDRFPTPLRKGAAMALLYLVLVATLLLPAIGSPLPIDTSRLSFGGVFIVQGLLALFLALWWLLVGRPPLAEFLALRSRHPLREAGAGVCLGLVGWVLTLVVGLAFALVLRLLGLPGPETASPLVQWIAELSILKRAVVVLCAMTIEEFHFRAFLQRRLGAVPASVFFLLAHAGYGEPFIFVGLLAITAVLAAAYQRTGAIWAPMLAHGTFNAVQLFIFVPEALKLLPVK